MKKTASYLFWDWKSIIKTTILFLVIGLGIFFYTVYPDWRRAKNAEKLVKETTGTVINYSTEEYISMSEMGNEIKAYSVLVDYSFFVDGKEHIATNKLTSTPKVQRFINQFKNGKSDCRVKYDEKDPSKNQLVINPK